MDTPYCGYERMLGENPVRMPLAGAGTRSVPAASGDAIPVTPAEISLLPLSLAVIDITGQALGQARLSEVCWQGGWQCQGYTTRM